MAREFFGTWESARRLALAMAAAHLGDGHDVVLPQMVNRVEEATRFEAAAAAAGATYVEVTLLVSPEAQSARFRAKPRPAAVDRHVGDLLDDPALNRIHGHHAAYLEGRPDALHLRTDDRGPEATYDELVALVGRVSRW